MSIWSATLADENALVAAAANWVRELDRPAFAYLSGDLGAGKSTFVRAALRALGYTGTVKSPTFSLLEAYSLNGWQAYHMDLYRLADPEELEYIGFRDLLDDADYLFIEWPEKAEGFLPEPTHRIELEHRPANARLVTISTQSSP